MHEFMVCMDPPQHDEHRGILSRFFTPRRLKKNEDFMWQLADEQMAPFVETGRCEFSGQYSSPFAGLVIADLLGVPTEDMPGFRAWFEQQLEHIGEQTITSDPMAFFQGSFERYVNERRAAPGDDVLSVIATATFSDGTTPDVAALAREAAFVFAAGQETTVRLLTFSLRYLAEHPDAQERLRGDRTLIPNFVEEMLRLESPIKVHFRLARRTTRSAGSPSPRAPASPSSTAPPTATPTLRVPRRGPDRPRQRTRQSRVQPRRPHLPGPVARPSRGPGDHRTGPRPDARHPHRRPRPRPRRRAPLDLPTDLALPRPHRLHLEFTPTVR